MFPVLLRSSTLSFHVLESQYQYVLFGIGTKLISSWY